MSHFSVLVIISGPNKPTHEDLAVVLQPYYEYECTGVEDQYVVDVDMTEEVKQDFEKYKEDGDVFGAAWVEQWCGAKEKDGRFYRRTNPNKKWDFWQVGGRYTGLLSPAYDPTKDPANREICILCSGTGKRDDALGREARAENPDYTCNGCDGSGVRTKWPTQWAPHSGDQMQVACLELSKIQDEREKEAAARYDKAHTVIAGRPFDTWEECRTLHSGDIERARAAYSGQEVIRDLRKDNVWCKPDQFKVDRGQYLAAARRRALQTFAVVKDGQWYERGEMGWWAVVHNEKERDAWDEEFEKLLGNLPPTSWLTVVDCHI